MSAEWQFKVGNKATLILNSRLCGSLRSLRPVRAVVCSARIWIENSLAKFEGNRFIRGAPFDIWGGGGV